MALWLVRAGSQGEQENLALKENVAIIGWEELKDLSNITSQEELFELLKKTYPNIKEKNASKLA